MRARRAGSDKGLCLIGRGTRWEALTRRSESAYWQFFIATLAIFTRQSASAIIEALSFMRVVAITGPRQSGKSTLARALAGEEALYRTLDEPDLLSFARSDPVGFLDVGDRRLVIDEFQRAPQLVLPLKACVDRDTRPGRFLITGSADLSALSSLQDALTGRLVRKVLLPLSQTELTGEHPRFLDAVLLGDLPQPARDARPLEEVVAAGGYPEPVALPANFRRQWFDAYAALTAQRDVADVLAIERPDMMTALVSQLALRTSETLNISDLSRTLQVARGTVDSYISALEQLYVVRRLQPWFRNELNRLAKTPKVHFLDAGLAAGLRRYQPGAVEQRTAFGPLLETFVFGELARLSTFHPDPPAIYHLRTLRGEEVDFILESHDRRIVAIEVKAGATLHYDWFTTMRMLRDAMGPAFVQGIVLYTGKEVRRFDDRMIAAPVSCLWGT
jgi:predicted AAA+ superfamily ATPase